MANEKTWEFAVNAAAWQPDTVTLTKWEVWWLAQVLLGRVAGVSTGTWTLVGSSDSSSVDNAGGDKWGSTFNASKIVRASSGLTAPHSWMCLSKADFGGVSGRTVYLVLDCINNTDANLFKIKWGLTAPGAGTINNCPSSTDQVMLGSQDAINNISVATQHYAHAMVATTGDFLFYESHVGSVKFHSVSGLIGLMDIRAGDNYAIVSLSSGAGSSKLLYPGPTSAWSNVGSGNVFMATRKHDGSQQIPAAAVGLLVGAAAGGTGIARPFALETGVDSLDGKYTDLPAYVFSTDSAGYVSIRGRIPDIRWKPESLPFDAVAPPLGGGVTVYEACGADNGNVWLPWAADVAPWL